MPFSKKIFPEFWDHKERVAGKKGQQYIFRKEWYLLIQVTCLLTLLPLALSTFLFYRNNKTETITDLLLETAVMTKGAAMDIEIFFDQHLATLRVISSQYPVESLKNKAKLKSIVELIGQSNILLSSLNIVDKTGRIVTSSDNDNFPVGYPLIDLKNRNLGRNNFVGQIITKKEKTNLAVSIKLAQTPEEPLFLTGVLDPQSTTLFLKKLILRDVVDIYILDKNGTLLTKSAYLGGPGGKISLSLSKVLPSSEVIADPRKTKNDDDFLFSGISNIGNTDMKLGLLISNRSFKTFMKRITHHILLMTFFSVLFVSSTILLLVTYVVKVLYRADKARKVYLTKAARSSRMASIGQLAAGVAHEINNPLAIINEKAGLLMDLFSFLEEYKNDDRLTAALESIIRAVERAGIITHRLLGFARKTDSSVQPIKVKDAVQEVLGFVQKEADYKSIDIAIQIPDNLPEIITDGGKLQQIVINLVNNAIAAMDENGSLSIKVLNNIQNESLEIFVQDNGCGIALEHQKQIFEPFFTTKAKIGGTGLGLSLTYGLIRDLHGTLELESEVGIGTTFTITLPYKITQEE